jgi:signal peptidase I
MADTPLPPQFTPSSDSAHAAPVLPAARDGIVPAGVNGISPRTENKQRSGSTETFGQTLAVWGIYAAILAGLWIVAAIGLTLYGMNEFLNVVGFATLLTLVAAFFVRTLFPLGSEKTQAVSVEKQHSPDSFREIIDTVVFVVVLVLMLKSFSAEAFVIPTGSMAPTLYGYQKVVTCPECGEKFPVNCSRQVEPSDGRTSYVGDCICPNCRKHISFSPPPEWRNEAGPVADSDRIPDPGWSSGDRVLVAKFVYDLLQRLPDRLDVVVFKYPGEAEGRDPFPYHSGPVKKHVPMNYIKRLIGLPGETIAIHRGKIFVLPPGMGPHYDDFEKAAGDPNKFALLWERHNTHPSTNDDDPIKKLFKAGKFTIVRKKPEVLLSMMRLVYDNDHQARDLKGPEYQRWVSAERSGWSASGDTGFAHDGTSATEGSWLRYRHVLRGSPDRPQLITDFTGYNTSDGGGDPGNWASDLVLECQAKVEKAEGNLILELSRGPDRFEASFDLAKDTCTLFRTTNDEKVELDSKPSPIKAGGTYKLRFANVDDRLVVWVDEKLIFGEGVTYNPAANFTPIRENDLDRPASIGAPGARVSVSKLKLWRDVYYTSGRDGGRPDSCDVAGFSATEPDTWKSFADAPVATYYVQPEHFLCLGDNSPASSDSRAWGLVPRRLMLGKALLVYYPFNRAGRIR